MPNKTEEYLALARKTADSFSRQWEHWAEFLITAARLYKYSYPDQLMIYAQRPDATACAEYDVWNNKMNRYVRRGSKGIALLDESGGYPRLHYVFDVSDTAPRRNALYPDLWQINESLKEPVRSMLAENYGVHSESFGQQLADVAGKLVQSYWDNNSSDILGIVDGSYLMSYDDAGRELQFKSAAAMGVTYMLLERCGLDPAGWFDEKDFQAVYDFTTPSAVYALGTAVSDCSREVLRQIERTVKTTIRRRNIERSQEEYEQQSELHEDRGLFSAEPDLESAPEAAEPVRQDAPELSDGAAPGGVQHDAAERDPVPAPVGDGTDGREQDATADERTVGEEPGSGQGEKTDGVGAAHEQPESAGGGNDPDRADLQLSFLEAAIPTEAQQIESIDQAESEKSPSAFVLSQSEIEYNALKEQYPDALVGFEQNGQFEFYGEDARKICELTGGKLLERETALGTVLVTGFPREQWVYRAKQLWECGENIYLAGLNEDGTHHQTKYLRKEEYLPVGSIVHMEGREFRVDKVDFDKDSVTLQDMALADLRMPIFREAPLAVVRELYEQELEPPVLVSDGLELPGEDSNKLPVSIEVNEVPTTPEAAAAEEGLNEEGAPEPAGNFRITDEELGAGGPKQKFARNIEAIKTLFNLEQKHRGATAEEQQVLSQYVGWGGLADAFDPDKSSWAKEYAELKGLLSEEEYKAARGSVLNAHYTSPTVIRAIYDAVERMGFRTGNILEPSMGVGNFFGMLPESMADSRLYGVELDSITGRIAQKLYPEANIKVAGFETTDRRDFYDLAVGNVPFGNYKVNDKAYNKLNFSIHNYFFAKAIDQVRPGGIVAFVTSRYTLDSKDSAARKHIAERADLLGAIRLPNNAFRANAGTDVVSDIIFLQKRDRPIDHEPAWVQLGKTADGISINSYFADHPEMILGKLTTENTQYGKEEATVVPIEGANLADQLREAVQQLEGQYLEAAAEVPDIAETEAERRTLPADPDVKNFSYTVVEGEVYYRENSVMTQVELSGNAKDRVVGMVELRQIVNELIDRQLNDYPEEEIKEAQEQLNAAYDAFTAQYGLLNDRKNGRLFEDDSSYYLLCSLENLDEQGLLKSKADMFTQRTIRPERVITSVNSPSEALAVSIGEHGKVDLPYMAELLGTPGEYAQITSELSGVIFKDPNADPADPEAGWQMADEYLSGDVRTKLRMAQFAAGTNPEFAVNVDALTKAQPRELEASEIDVRLGATWLAPEIIQKFMAETFQIPYYMRHSINVKFSQRTAEWRIEGKTAMGKGDIMSCETYGTSRANAYKILEETLNLKDVRIYDTIEDDDGKPKRVLNKRETMLAQQKQQSIKDAFANWIWQDPQRRISLVRQYNELFNSTRPREYNGEHIHFVGMNPEISLREHQRNAIAHVLYGGNTLLAHEVGAGKTFEMAASAMEAKRLGLCQKSLFVVPNHLTEQWAAEFLHLYPNAKLLVARRKDFETANRKKFCARIATGDYDAVIIGHSQFERIPLSFERQERIIQEQIDEIQDAISELKYASGERFTVKQMEKSRKNLEQKLEKLRAADRKDDVITFEQLGVDRLFVDESHAFKNLFLYTKMRNVAGLSTSEAQKSSDMFGKCRYLDEVTGGRGVIFATGTPVSNSMTELYTVMRYLQYGTLQKKNLTHFDCWASTFGETTTAIELAPEGYTLIGR